VSLNSLTTYVYDSVGRVTRITDPMGHNTNYTYDAYGQPADKKDDLTNPLYPHLRQFNYFPSGDISRVTDGNAHYVTYNWDNGGFPVDTTDANQYVIYESRDNWSRKTATTRPAVTVQPGIAMQIAPVNGRIGAQNGASTGGTQTPITSTVYDDDGLPIIETDENGNQTLTTYDNAGRPTAVTTQRESGVNDVVRYGYDGTIPGSAQTVAGQKGLLTATVDGNGRTLLYGYDARDRVTTRIYPDMQFNPANTVSALDRETYTYDDEDNPLSKKDRSNATTNFVYDNAGQLTQTVYPTGTPTVYTYYPDGELKTMADVTGTTTYVLDKDRELTQLLRPAPIGNVLYTYDAAHRRTKTTTSAGDILYTYDAADNLKTVTSPTNEVTTYTYDAGDRVTSIALANGATSTYTYDTNDRVTGIVQKNGVGATLLTHAYGYDLAGNVTLRTDTKAGADPVAVAYGYDKRNQIKVERAQKTGTSTTPLYQHEYGYDSNLNRTGKTVTLGTNAPTTEAYTLYPNSDRVKTAASKTYSYDAKGNVSNVSVGGTSSASAVWNADNRLTSLTNSGGTSLYTYNGAGLRTGKTVNGGTTKSHLTDGDGPASALLSDGNATYVPGVSERRGSVTSFFLFDLLGSVRAVSGAGGAATEFSLSDAFGNPFLTLDFGGATTAGRPFGFVGAEQYQQDAESGLMLLGNRFYDPSIGRFLSSDPAESGSNWYAYCENNPVRWTDAKGLDIAIEGDKAFKKMIDDAIAKLRKTKRGRELLQPYDPPKGKKHGGLKLKIRKQTHEEANAENYNPVAFTDPVYEGDPNKRGRRGKPRNTTIAFHPLFASDPSVELAPSDGYMPPDNLIITIVLGHELGHANGWADDGPDDMNNIIDNENVIRRQLGLPDREKY